MSGLRIGLFGKFFVQRNEAVVSGLEATKLQEMFSYLLLHRSRPQPRESLAALLWGDCATAQSKKYLRQTLWHLQSTLNCKGGCSEEPLLVVDADWISINTAANWWLDVAAFEQTYTSVQNVSGQQMDAQKAAAVKQAVALYRGDLLENCYQDWCLYERERLQNMLLIMLDKLMAYTEANSEFDEGIGYGDHILSLDRAREHTHRRLMQLYALAGNRTSALRQYERCAAALDEELGVQPAKKTRELYETIRADRFESLLTRPPLPASLPDLTEQLKGLQHFLVDLQDRIQREIRTVEEALQNQYKPR